MLHPSRFPFSILFLYSFFGPGSKMSRKTTQFISIHPLYSVSVLLQVFCVLVFLTAVSLFGTLISQLNEIVLANVRTLWRKWEEWRAIVLWEIKWNHLNSLRIHRRYSCKENHTSSLIWSQKWNQLNSSYFKWKWMGKHEVVMVTLKYGPDKE